MTRMLCRQICLIAFVLIVLLGGTRVQAAPRAHCFSDLADCYGEANLNESFWAYYWDALDCELTFIGCVREAVFGD